MVNSERQIEKNKKQIEQNKKMLYLLIEKMDFQPHEYKLNFMCL